jgi:hypothetical protein
MTRDTIKWIEINWKVLDTINDNRSTFGSTEEPLRCRSVPPWLEVWGPTSPIRVHRGVDIPGSRNIFESCEMPLDTRAYENHEKAGKNHPTLTGQDTRDWAARVQLVSHQ